MSKVLNSKKDIVIDNSAEFEEQYDFKESYSEEEKDLLDKIVEFDGKLGPFWTFMKKFTIILTLCTIVAMGIFILTI